MWRNRQPANRKGADGDGIDEHQQLENPGLGALVGLASDSARGNQALGFRSRVVTVRVMSVTLHRPPHCRNRPGAAAVDVGLERSILRPFDHRPRDGGEGDLDPLDPGDPSVAPWLTYRKRVFGVPCA